MESEIKPKVLKTINDLTKEYNKLIKISKRKINCVLKSNIFPASKEKNYKKIVEKILRYKITSIISISFRGTCTKTS